MNLERNKKFRSLIIFMGLMCAVCCVAQLSASELQVRATPIGFPNPSYSPATLVEFSYSVNADGLTFLPDTAHGDYVAGIFAIVVLYDNLSLPIDSTSQAFATRSLSESDSSMLIVNRLRLIIPPGNYSAKLTVSDVASKESASQILSVKVGEAVSKKLLISGLEMAHVLEHVGADTTGNSLIKNGWKVYPDPVGYYSTKDSLINIYAEIYNLKPDTTGKFHIGARVELVAPGDIAPIILSEVYWEVQGSSIVFTRKLEHQVVTSGVRTLNLIITDPATSVTDTSSRQLYFRDPAQFEEAVALSNSSYDTTSLDTRTQMIYWLLTPRERELMSSLNEVGQQQYIAQFWLDNGDRPTIGITPFRDDVFKRYRFAIKKYSFTSEAQDGWKRDPGRVLLQYGFPDEIIDVPIPSIENDITGESGWERWNYDRLQGGVYFIFANEYGYSDYRLKHSNAQGETFDQGIEDNINQLFRQSGG